jgi:hypothetical protein
MTTQSVSAQIMLNTGESVNLQSTFTDGTESELKTAGNNVSSGGGVSAQSIGVFAEGKAITSFIQPVTAATKCVYAYISRRGEILKVLPVATNATNSAVYSKPYPSSWRYHSSFNNVVTNRGVNAIFAVTPTGGSAGGTSNELTHILTNQGIGSSLQGQQIMSHFTNSSDAGKYMGGSVLVLNDRGLPIGSSLAVNQNNLQVEPSMMGTCGIGLNFQAVVLTTS